VKIHRRSEAGFTALEVLVAAVLLAIGLVVSAQLMVVAMSQGHLAKQGSDASTLAAKTIEQYRDANYAAITGGTFYTYPTVGSDAYTVRADVVRNDPQTNMTRVRVTVTWNSGVQSYVSETILSNLQ
jgi:prepilin-type N-terminal cleavage/methylation domain-containing protein